MVQVWLAFFLLFLLVWELICADSRYEKKSDLWAKTLYIYIFVFLTVQYIRGKAYFPDCKLVGWEWLRQVPGWDIQELLPRASNLHHRRWTR